MKKENKLDTFEIKEQEILSKLRSLLKISKTMKIEIEHAIEYKDLYTAKIFINKNEYTVFEFHVKKNINEEYCYSYIECFTGSLGMENFMNTIINMHKNNEDIFNLLREYISLHVRQ